MEGDSDESEIDARGSNPSEYASTSTVSKKKITTYSEKKRVSSCSDCPGYYMENEKRRKCIIINEKNFQPHICKKERKGTDDDASSLEKCFRELNFDVKRRDNLPKDEILAWLNTIAKDEDYHSLSDCFVCCILSHGGYEGLICSTDDKISTDEIFDMFTEDKCGCLAGKPKMFLIQACQGAEPDPGVQLMFEIDKADSPTASLVWNKINFLIANSTVPGYLSWRNGTGSWFIQTLCEVFQENARSKDLLSMLTEVNLKVALYCESYCPKVCELHEKKQVPSVTSTLTQKVYFYPRQ